jgi:glutamate transport system substrate-binding protein
MARGKAYTTRPAVWFCALISIAVLVVISTGCDLPKTGTEPVPHFSKDTAMHRVQAVGHVRIGVRFDQPGIGQRDAATGAMSGFDIEIARSIAQAIFGGAISDIDSRVRYVEAFPRNREDLLRDGTVDLVIAPYTPADARGNVVSFAGPYLIGQGALLVRSDSAVQVLSDLHSERVCVVSGTIYSDRMGQFVPGSTLVQVERYSQCADALREGRVDAVAGSDVVLAGFVASSAGTFRLTGAGYSEETFGIAFTHDDATFHDFLDDRLSEIEADGRWQRAWTDTAGRFGVAVQPPPIDKSTG